MPADRAAPARAPRVDALRNREAILNAARAVFETEGVLASLDGVAMRAGVGNATLYRNFPTRADLLAAAMEADLAEACAKAESLGHERPAQRALAEWAVWLTWRLRLWHDLPQCVAEASTGSATGLTLPVAALAAHTERLLEAARAAGQVVLAVTGQELFELITALSWAVDRFGDDDAAARRRVEVATAGLFTAA